MDKLRIGVMLDPDNYQSVGGGFSYYDTLLDAIDKHNFHDNLEFVFINTGKKKDLGFTKPVLDINIYELFKAKDYFFRFFYSVSNLPVFRFKPLFWHYLKYYKKIYYGYVEKILCRNKIDILYYLVPGPTEIEFPYVLTHWDNGHLSMESYPEVAYNYNYEWREEYYNKSLKMAFSIFCESVAGRDELLKYTNIEPRKVQVVPMFAGKVSRLSVPVQMMERTLEKYALESKGFFFYPAQFWAHKNHYNLLLAFQRFLKDYPGIKLVLSGSDKGNLPYIKNVMDALGLNDRVVITGFVDNEAVYTFYKHALALVMPTFLGPTNMPLLEAQETGCPVICSNLEGHKEMLGDGAFYFQPDNPQDIYEKLMAFMSNPPETEPAINPTFNLFNALKSIEQNFLQLLRRRKTFGYNFK